MGLGGFISARALSHRNEDPQAASRPFDADRDGTSVSLVIGYGSLEEPVVEQIEHRTDSGWLPAELVRLVKKWKPVAVGCNGAGPLKRRQPHPWPWRCSPRPARNGAGGAGWPPACWCSCWCTTPASITGATRWPTATGCAGRSGVVDRHRPLERHRLSDLELDGRARGEGDLVADRRPHRILIAAILRQLARLGRRAIGAGN